jgi:hypothetical protein
MGSADSNPAYLQVLWEKLVVIHGRKTRNLNEFSFCVVKYLWITISVSLSRKHDMKIGTLGPISSGGSPVRAASASILAPKSPTPPIDSGPKRRMMAPAPAATQAIIGTDCPLIALVART